MRILLVIFAILGIIFITSPELSLASFRAPDVDLPDKGAIPGDTGLFQGTSLIEAVVIIIRWILGFIGIIIFGIMLFAGFEYATAGGDESKTKNAQNRIANAIIGLIILFFAFVASNAILSFVFQTNPNNPNNPNNTNNTNNRPNQNNTNTNTPRNNSNNTNLNN
jgi:amino acid transporter